MKLVFMDILEYPRMKLVFSYKYMLGCNFSLTKFSLLIDHLRKPRKLHTTKISAYTVCVHACMHMCTVQRV